jgi:hypothetical protein
MTDRQDARDAALEAALAQALGPGAGDTAPLSQAVLRRIVEDGGPGRPGLSAGLAMVLADPRPLAALTLGALLLAGALGYAFVPLGLQETVALALLIGEL